MTGLNEHPDSQLPAAAEPGEVDAATVAGPSDLAGQPTESPGVSRPTSLALLGATTAGSVARRLDAYFEGQVHKGEVVPAASSHAAFAASGFPAVAAGVRNGPGLGAAVLVISAPSAHAITQALGGHGGEAPPPPTADDPGWLADGDHHDPSEADLEALMPPAAAIADAVSSSLSMLLGRPVKAGEPSVVRLDSPEAAETAFGAAPFTLSTVFAIAGYACRLIQLIPEALAHDPALDDSVAKPGLSDALSDIYLRVWAEIGRTRLPLGRALELPPGAVLELDQGADEPVEIYVNGLLFATGSLLTTDQGEWAVRLERLEGAAATRPHAAPADAVAA